MIDPALASIRVDPSNQVRSLRETTSPKEQLLEATIIRKRNEKRCRVVARPSVDRNFCGHEGLPEPECES